MKKVTQGQNKELCKRLLTSFWCVVALLT